MKRLVLSGWMLAMGLSLTSYGQEVESKELTPEDALLPAVEEKKPDFRLQANLSGTERGKAVLFYFSKGKMVQDTVDFEQAVLRYTLSGKDTVKGHVRMLSESLGTPTARAAMHYPSFGFMIVPGEHAVLHVILNKGKIPQVEWVRGGPVGSDFIRSEYALMEPDEAAYNQLIIDNIIRGGDIREYTAEFETYFRAQKRRIMAFVRENPESYYAALKLFEHFQWFDENEAEHIYEKYPLPLKNTAVGRAIRQKLAYNTDSRNGMPAAGFTKKELSGKRVSLDDYRGKFVLLDFWGSWCGPCRESHPHMKDLYRKYGDKVVFIHIAQENIRDLAEAREAWIKAVKEDGLTWTQILNNEDKGEFDLVKLYRVNAFPTKILIDPEGRIAGRYVGGMFDTSEKLEKKLEEISKL